MVKPGYDEPYIDKGYVVCTDHDENQQETDHHTQIQFQENSFANSTKSGSPSRGVCDSNIPTRDAVVILGGIDNNVPTTSIDVNNKTVILFLLSI